MLHILICIYVLLHDHVLYLNCILDLYSVYVVLDEAQQAVREDRLRVSHSVPHVRRRQRRWDARSPGKHWAATAARPSGEGGGDVPCAGAVLAASASVPEPRGAHGPLERGPPGAAPSRALRPPGAPLRCRRGIAPTLSARPVRAARKCVSYYIFQLPLAPHMLFIESLIYLPNPSVLFH